MLQVPDGLAGLLDDVTVMSALASIVMLAVSLVAIVAWCVRSAGRAVRMRVTRRHAAPERSLRLVHSHLAGERPAAGASRAANTWSTVVATV